MSTPYKIFVIAAMLIITVGLTECYKRHIPQMMDDIYTQGLQIKELEDRILMLENKINLAIKVADGIVFLRDPISKFTFDYDKEER